MIVIMNRVDFNRKVLAMLLICTLMTSVLIPNRSYAVAPAIPLAAVGGAVLLIGGVAVIASELGYQAEANEMDILAGRLWDGATSEVKSALESAYNAAYNAGDKMMDLGTPVTDFIKSSIAKIIGVQLAQNYISGRGDYIERSRNTAGDPIYHVGAPDGYLYVYSAPDWADVNLRIGVVPSMRVSTGATSASSLVIPIGSSNTQVWIPIPGLTNKAVELPDALTIILSQTGGGAIVKTSDWNLINQKITALKNAVPASIPVPMAKDFVVVGADDTKPVRTPLVLQPDNTWKNTETGKVYNPADTKVQSYPKVKTVTDATTGTTVGTVVQDGVDVNVRTGEKVGDATANPPIDLNPPSGSINWGPLKAVGSLFTTKFPFSIPWDIARQLSIFDVTPQTPIFDVDIPKFFDFDGTKFGMKFHVDLSAFDTIALIARWASTIVFDIGLILSMRKLMPE